MKILITGGAGFIGSNLIENLCNNNSNIELLSLDNYSTGSRSNHIINNKIKYIEHDLCENIDHKSYKNLNVVVHCAAKARIKYSFINDEEYFKTNIIGTYNIVKLCHKNNIPLIYIGTSSHHGGKFLNPYTFTKDVGEDIVTLYQECFGLKASIARLYNVYGPKELTNDNGTLIGKLKYCYYYHQKFTLYGDGSKKRDFTHVYDIVDAIIRIIEKKAYGYTFELGRGDPKSIKEIIDLFEPIDVIYQKNIKGEMQETFADCKFAKKILNWVPYHKIEDYIEEIKMNRDFKYDPIN